MVSRPRAPRSRAAAPARPLEWHPLASFPSLTPPSTPSTRPLPSSTVLRIPAIHQKLAAAPADAKSKGLRHYDIRTPRAAQAAALDDSPDGRYIARLSGHHQNSHEILPIIAVAVFGALQRGVPEASVSAWASLFLASRVVYTGVYIGGASAALGYTRALVWAAGLAICVHLLAVAK